MKTTLKVQSDSINIETLLHLEMQRSREIDLNFRESITILEKDDYKNM